ncbi:hypothetical protein LTS18_013299, partial [Coniosporium uncinatum]
MSRTVKIAACQVGTVNRWDDRKATLNRLIKLLEDASAHGARIALFPETAFTTFFPRYLFTSNAELDTFFEHGDITTAPQTCALFDRARDLHIDICIGFAEATTSELAKSTQDGGQCYNTCIYWSAHTDSVLSKYRKIHLP